MVARAAVTRAAEGEGTNLADIKKKLFEEDIFFVE